MKFLTLLIALFGLTSCFSNIQRLPESPYSRSKKDPALSGDGKKLAFIADINGRPTVQIQNIRNGKILPLRHLSRHQPHFSPSLSWNGRYLAVLAQEGPKKVAIIEDRFNGKKHKISFPGKYFPLRLSLSPDATKLAVQFIEKGKWRVNLFDLTNKLELDLPSSISPVDSLSD